MKSVIFAALLTLPALAQEPSAKGVNFYWLDQEIRIGQQIGADLERTLPIVHVPRLDAYVTKLGAELASHADPRFPYRFTVYEDRGFPAVPPIALAMPKDPFLGQPVEPVAICGGPIFVPISLLANADNEAEFAFQLAHAIAHIAQRHATREETREEIVDMAMAPVTTQRVAHVAGAMEYGIEVGLHNFVRGFEREADSVATGIVADAGFDPEEAVRFLERQAGAGVGATGKMFAVRPTPERRIETIRAKLEQLPPRTYSLSTPEFAQMKTLAANLR